MANDTSTKVEAATQDAKQDFEKVASTLHDKGAREAYKALAQESQKTKVLPVEERQAWQKEMVSQLSQSHNGKEPILPGLSVAYLEGNKGSFSNRNGQISYDKIDVRKTINELNLQIENLNPKVDKVDNVEAALLDSLSSAPDDKIRKAIDEKRDFSTQLLTEAVKGNEAQTKRKVSLEQTDANERSAANGLLANNGRLFDLLDTSFGHEKPDGRISFENVKSACDLFQKYPSLKSALSNDEIATLNQLKTVFTDENNRLPRAGSIVGHDSMATIIAEMVPSIMPVDSLFVSRETIAGRLSGHQGTEKDTARIEAPGKDKESDSPDSTRRENPSPKSGETQAVGAAHAEKTSDIADDTTGSTTETAGAYNSDRSAPLNDPLIVGRGEGYWHVARRMLKGSPEFSNAAIAEVSRTLQAANGNRMLRPDENLTQLSTNEHVLALIDKIHNQSRKT